MDDRLFFVEVKSTAECIGEGVVIVEVDGVMKSFCLVKGRTLTKKELLENFKIGDTVSIRSGIVKEIR